MAKIFGSSFTAGTSRVYTGKRAAVHIDGIASPGLVTGWNITFTRNPTPIYPLGSTAVHYVLAPPSGTLGFERILSDDMEFINMLSKDCSVTSVTLKASDGLCSQAGETGAHTYVCGGVIFSSYSGGMNAQAPYIAENIGATISSLEII